MKIFSIKKLTLSIAILAVVVAVGSTASAEILKAFATRVANDTDITTGVPKMLTDAGATSLGFSVAGTARKLIKITFNAECGVLGPPGSWISVTILVDGVEANPKNNLDFALCTATSTTIFSWMGAVRQSLIPVEPGSHSVVVRIDRVAGATQWWLGDSSIVVEQK
jgi:hypothetical protein